MSVSSRLVVGFGLVYFSQSNCGQSVRYVVGRSFGEGSSDNMLVKSSIRRLRPFQ